MGYRTQNALERSWYQPNILTVLLWPLSLVYRSLIALRTGLYKLGVMPSYRASVPVVVVGNITVGGTGKTPLVIHLVEGLRAAGFNPAVISRGYGGSAKHTPLLVTSETDPMLCGDEPALIAQRTGVPVVIGARRAASIDLLLTEHDVDVVISDDGLQHLAVERDVEICVMDATRQGANMQLLPAGPYREPSSRLDTVDFIVRNGASVTEHSYAMRLRPAPVKPVQAGNEAVFDASQGVHAVAAIGNPERFFQTCEAQGWRIDRHAFPDHHKFTVEEIEFNDGKPVVMTEKDAVKCVSFARQNHWVLPVDAKLTPELVPQIVSRLKPHDRP